MAAGHPLWSYLARAGLRRELEELASDPCPPDILGLDYYPPSERFLDDRLEPYPARTHTSNGRDSYADLDAVRVLAKGLTGFERLALGGVAAIRLAAGRYRGASRLHARGAAPLAQGDLGRRARLRARGVDVRAVTAWALLGSYDWDSLLTRRRGHYETGAFDVRTQQPRPTAVARIVRDLATKGDAKHPVLDSPGWWRPQGSLRLACRSAGPGMALRAVPRCPAEARPLLITGGGRSPSLWFMAAIARPVVPSPLPRRARPADPQAVAAALQVLSALGGGQCRRLRLPRRGAGGRRRLPARQSRTCLRSGQSVRGGWHPAARLVVSSGVRWLRAPAVSRSDAPAPRGVYASCKLEAERVLASCPRALLVRAGLVRAVGSGRPCSRGRSMRCTRGRPFLVAEDVTISPSYLPHLVTAALDLLIDGECGIWHWQIGVSSRMPISYGRSCVGARPPRGTGSKKASRRGAWLGGPRALVRCPRLKPGLPDAPLDQAIATYLEAAPAQWSSGSGRLQSPFAVGRSSRAVTA